MVGIDADWTEKDGANVEVGLSPVQCGLYVGPGGIHAECQWKFDAVRCPQ